MRYPVFWGIGNLLRQQQRAPDVYFPIERTEREFPGSLLLGTRLASDGFNAVIGPKELVKRLILSSSSSGIAFYKGVAEQTFRRPDFAYVGQDPETGLIYRNYSDFVQRRKIRIFRNFHSTDAYFTYGRFDFDYLTSAFPKAASRIHATGSPRTMLWGESGNTFFGPRIEAIQERYGEFCLLVSRAGRSARKSAGGVTNYVAQVAQTAETLLQRARKIRRVTGLNVVIRPHPSEDWMLWRKSVIGLEGIFVDSAFELGAWIRAAKFVVQAPISTAAFEAWMAGVPSIASEQADFHIAADGSCVEYVSHELCVASSVWEDQFLDVDSVLRQSALLRGSRRPNDIVRNRISWEGEDATKAIAKRFANLVNFERPSGIEVPFPLAVRSRIRRDHTRRMLNVERLGRRAAPPYKKWPVHLRRVVRDVSLARRVLGITSEIEAVQLLPDCFLLRRAR